MIDAATVPGAPIEVVVKRCNEWLKDRGHRLHGDDPRLANHEFMLGEAGVARRRTLADVLAIYVAKVGKRQSPGTTTNRISVIRSYFGDWLDHSIDAVTPMTLSARYAKLVRPIADDGLGIRPDTATHYVRRLLPVLRWAYAQHYLTTNVAVDARLTLTAPASTTPRPVIELAEYQKLLTIALSPVLVAFLRIGWETGLRISEILALNVGDLNHATLQINVRWHLVNGKRLPGTKWDLVGRDVPMTNDLAAYLRAFAVGRPSDAPLFLATRGGRLLDANFRRSLWRPFVAEVIAAGVLGPEFGTTAEAIAQVLDPHLLRHSFATMQGRDDTMTEFRLMALLGHKSSETLRVYLHRGQTEVDAGRAAMRRILGIE